MSTIELEAPRAQVNLRPIGPGDAEAVARIIHAAFAGIHDHHRFPRDFPTLEAAAGLAAAFSAHPHIWGIVAELGGRVVGSNFLDERGPVRGVGPITVDPDVQTRRIGRRLMEAVIERGAAGRDVRLLQDAFNGRSMALYTDLGFRTREPVVLMGGRPRPGLGRGVDVSPLQEGDLDACDALHRRVHGFERARELRDALASPLLQPRVARRDGRIVAFVTGVSFFPAAFGVAETHEDLFGLIVSTLEATGTSAAFLLPTRQFELFRACLSAGLRVVKPMTYMTLREYEPPAGAWFPTVLY